MSGSDHKPTKQDLLEELESIRQSLLDPAAPLPPPKSRHLYRKQSAAHHADRQEQNTMSNKPLPGQQSLFDEAPSRNSSAGAPRTSAKPATTNVATPLSDNVNSMDNHDLFEAETTPENPFLPQHIRDRLIKEKASFREHHHQTMEQLSSDKTDADERLVDELVAKYLPKIEEELREKLRAQIKISTSDTDTAE